MTAGFLYSTGQINELAAEKTVVLLSSFECSLRNMTQRCQDTIGIIQKFRKPDFFHGDM